MTKGTNAKKRKFEKYAPLTKVLVRDMEEVSLLEIIWVGDSKDITRFNTQEEKDAWKIEITNLTDILDKDNTLSPIRPTHKRDTSFDCSPNRSRTSHKRQGSYDPSSTSVPDIKIEATGVTDNNSPANKEKKQRDDKYRKMYNDLKKSFSESSECLDIEREKVLAQQETITKLSNDNFSIEEIKKKYSRKKTLNLKRNIKNMLNLMKH